MYSLDVNFLKDRGLNQTETTKVESPKPKKSLASKLPIVAGAIAAIIFPVVTFSYLKKIEQQQAEAQQDIQTLEAEIAEINRQNQNVEQIKQQVQQAKQETIALVSVFEKIKPWSAILAEVGDRTPPGVQVDSLQQSGSGANTQLILSGTARSYDAINDFVLFLQRSKFFDGNATKLNSANQAGIPLNIENRDELPEEVSLEIPQGVKYTVTTQLSNIPASQLIQELDRKGSSGLVTRLKTLERKGAI